MDARRALYWSGRYVATTAAAAVVGLALVAAGLSVGLAEGVEIYRNTGAIGAALATAAPGLVLALLGVGVWRFVSAVAFYRTLTGAVEAELSETYDNEKVKSEILSVLDERLSDMQQDLQSMDRKLKDIRRPDEEFQFEG